MTETTTARSRTRCAECESFDTRFVGTIATPLCEEHDPTPQHARAFHGYTYR